jgi:anti-anti-sigma factor
MPDVELSASIRDGHVIVALCGDLDVTGAGAAGAAITALATRGQWLVIDMSAPDFMDCGSLSALLGVRRLARQVGGDRVLAAPRTRDGRRAPAVSAACSGRAAPFRPGAW